MVFLFLAINGFLCVCVLLGGVTREEEPGAASPSSFRPADRFPVRPRLRRITPRSVKRAARSPGVRSPPPPHPPEAFRGPPLVLAGWAAEVVHVEGFFFVSFFWGGVVGQCEEYRARSEETERCCEVRRYGPDCRWGGAKGQYVQRGYYIAMCPVCESYYVLLYHIRAIRIIPCFCSVRFYSIVAFSCSM